MAITAGSNLNSVPAPGKQTLSSNYIDFTATATAGWAQQYLPDLMEKEAEVFGNRTISGFLSMVGAEEPMTSDQVVWSEQGRLHLSYLGHVHSTSGGQDSCSQLDIISDIDGNTDVASGNHGIRVNDTLIISDTTNGVKKALVVGVSTDRIDVAVYGAAALSGTTSGSATTILVYGSEYTKGTEYFLGGSVTTQTNQRGSNEPSFKSFTNKPIILKDKFEVSGSDASQIGWVEVSGEGGQSGYLWYMKAEGDTRVRFEDYLEMTMVEAEFAKSSGGVDAILGTEGADNTAGTEGLFAAIQARGHVAEKLFDDATDLISDFDEILKKLDKQGAIEENLLFLNRTSTLKVDDALANISAGSAGGTAFGIFENSEDMALNLGFRGFRRGSYDFYKTDWKYLNNSSTRGLFSDIEGVLVPAGTSSVYDQMLGKNVRRPFLHVRYKASEADDRRMKSWITGSVGGAATSDLDVMEVHYLSERCLVTQAANNFMLFKA